MSTTESTVLRCASCDGEIQATSKIYWTLDVAGQWEPVDFTNEELELYCANDCADIGLTDEQDRTLRILLGRLVFDLGSQHVGDPENLATLSGMFHVPDAPPEDLRPPTEDEDKSE